MSGLTYANSWLGIGHSVCHSLGGRYGLSHGAANSVMVLQSLRFNFHAAHERLAQIARAAGIAADGDEHPARLLVARIEHLAEVLERQRPFRRSACRKASSRKLLRMSWAIPRHTGIPARRRRVRSSPGSSQLGRIDLSMPKNIMTAGTAVPLALGKDAFRPAGRKILALSSPFGSMAPGVRPRPERPCHVSTPLLAKL